MVIVRHLYYLGTDLAAPELRHRRLRPVLNQEDKWIRGPNGNVLVELEGHGLAVVPGKGIRWMEVLPPTRWMPDTSLPNRPA